MAANQTPELCEYCKQIDFGILRLPTVADLRDANNRAVVDAQPFRQTRAGVAGLARPPRWRLGSRARIEKDKGRCKLCDAICALVRDTPDLQAALGSLGARDDELLCSAGVEGTFEFHPLPGTEWEVSTGYYRSYRLGLDWWPRKKPADPKPAPGKVGGEHNDAELPPGKVGGEYNDAVGKNIVSAADCFQTRGGGEAQFGGRIRKEMINIELPKRWLKECMENHGGECKGWSAARQAAKGTGSSSNGSKDAATPKLPSPLRLIDTHGKKLVEFENPAADKLQYAALSYVWGENQRLKLLKDNRTSLKQPSSLAGEVASPTIQDAIQFVADLDIPYIWVDALCIVQDDDADKAVQIGAMCDIYASAAVTIIAAAGPDAASRLPGVRVPEAPELEVRRTRKQVCVRVGPDMELLTSLAPRVDHHTAASQTAAIPGDAHVLNGTAWSTRGWTLQERAVSRRLLAFTPQQLIWTCPTLSESEETECSSELATARLDALGSRTPQRLSFTEHYANGPVPSPSSSKEESYRRFWYAFQHLVLDFSSRELRLPGDAHNAFSAVLAQATSMTGEEFVWALPAGRFALALTWTPWREGLKRRTELTTLPTTTLHKKVPFPSWSWLGWMGKVQYRIGEQVQSSLEPDVVCYTVRHKSSAVKNAPGNVNNTPNAVKNAPNIAKNATNAVKNATNAVKNVPNIVKNAPDTAKNAPNAVRHAPNAVNNTPNTIKNSLNTYVHLIGSAADPTTAKLLKTHPSEVTLKQLEEHNPPFGGPAGLDGIPDNQMIFLWAECAYFTISTRQAGGRGMFFRFLYNSDGVNVGRISPCREDEQADGAGTKNRRFALLATRKQKSIPSEKIVLMLQPGPQGDGVWYRSEMAVIEEDKWLSAKPKRELVALA